MYRLQLHRSVSVEMFSRKDENPASHKVLLNFWEAVADTNNNIMRNRTTIPPRIRYDAGCVPAIFRKKKTQAIAYFAIGFISLLSAAPEAISFNCIFK